jgi:heterodisulfide reductase subunit A2
MNIAELQIINGKESKLTGAVLVQGGGIAGVQAALDLAGSGFKVYLLEQSAAIGGMMSYLDKTFPTGDCATCIVSPKLVECAHNDNIEIITLSELEKLEGEPGNFKATIRKRPRYIDESICNACGDCLAACPVDLSNDFNRGLDTRKAVASQYPQAVPNVFNILKNGHAPCKQACPAQINVQGYIQLIKKKEYQKAIDLIRERNPLAAICGRICTHPCESACTRGEVDDPVAIKWLKRFASEKEMESLQRGEFTYPDQQKPPTDAKKVGVIGAGPAGLTVADDLAQRGFAVTIYEALPMAGGMLAVGIPEYRLPREVLDHEVELIRRKGVSFEFNCRIGRDKTLAQLQKENDAVFIATGAPIRRMLNIEGEELQGVEFGVDYLRKDMLGESADVKGKTIVIGGGNSAIDAARTALRRGCEVTMVNIHQSLDEMFADRQEVEDAIEEGIQILCQSMPVRITGENGRVKAMEFAKIEPGDDSGQSPFVPIKGTEFTLQADTVIVAISQDPDLTILDNDIETDGRRLKTDPTTLQTSVEGMFGGGDAVSGAASVIEAVAAGKRAADSIERYLKGEELGVPRFEDKINPVNDENLPDTDKQEKKPRSAMPKIDTSNRLHNFEEVETGLCEEDALREAERCLNCAACSECGECVTACKQNAILHDMVEQVIELEVGAVLLTPGFEEFRAERKGEFGLGRYDNVVSSVQFERMLSASGPFEGHLQRLSDGGPVKRVAFIQCVGSRDSSCGNEYCSAICCMAATKEAMVAMEHEPGLQASIFYMDIRAYGKDFDAYYERAKNNAGVKYIRSIPSRVVELPASKSLQLRYYNESGKRVEEEFDLVVLSVGIEPNKKIKEKATQLGVELNGFGFCSTNALSPTSTSRKGIYVAGAFQGPKDIPETVTQASAAACDAMELLSSSRHSLFVEKRYPTEKDINGEGPRIGVFVCHCGINISGVVDVKKVLAIAANEANVVHADDAQFTCSDTSLTNIRAMIEEHRLNRVVIASCTPRTHEALFQQTLQEAGLNPYLFELANIRDQCSWVHSKNPAAATDKACDLVRMSIARARLLTPLKGGKLPVNQAGLVIGAGLSGMTAALALADQGFNVHLVERDERIGGNLLNVYSTLEGNDVPAFTKGLIERVKEYPNLSLYLNTEVEKVAGHIGKFSSILTTQGKQTEIRHGVIILATGAKPVEYDCGKNKNKIIQTEMEKQLHDGSFPDEEQNVVMIQCADSRNDNHPYCSRVCCSMAVKNAIAIKEKNPDSNVFVLYRDIRTYGFREVHYQKARRLGVVFIRYDERNPAQVDENNLVALDSPDFPERIEIEADWVVMSTGMQAQDGNTALSQLLKLTLNSDGFFLEAHMKLRPVDFATEGIFLCGLAHSPKFIEENISQAKAAAARAATVLSKKLLDVGALVSRVDQQKCISCLTCVKACPYGAPVINEDGKAYIEAAKCLGCGICAAECPACAAQLGHYRREQFGDMLDALFTGMQSK